MIRPQRGATFLPTIAIVVALSAVLAAGYFLFIDLYTSRTLQVRIGEIVAGTVPADLQDARYLLSARNGGGIYHDGELRYDDYQSSGRIVIDLAYEGEAVAKIVRAPDGIMSGVVVDGREIVSSPEEKRSLALSPSGTFVAFSEKTADGQPGDAASWYISVIDVATGLTEDYPGFLALFLSDEELILFLEDGIYITNRTTKEQSKVVDMRFFASYAITAAVSKERDRFAWSEEAGQLRRARAYELNSSPEWTLTEMGAFTTVEGPIAVTTDHLYALAPKGESVQVRQYPLAGGAFEVIRTFPSILNVTRLLP